MREHLRHIGMPDTWGTHVELFAAATYFNIPVYTFVADPKNLRWEVYKPLTTKNLHYPVTVNNEDELFTTQHVKVNNNTCDMIGNSNKSHVS